MTKGSDIYTNRRASRPKQRKKSWLAIPVIVVLALAATFAAQSFGPKEQKEATYDATELEKVVIPDDVPEIMADYTGFKVSFNPAHHEPNYVVWELTAAEAAGDIPRENKFRPDPDILGSPALDDYRNSGFDRGHMAPAGDMKWSAAAMADSHYLTNMCPQTRQLNGGRWSTLEQKCRQWAARDSVLVIVCGPILTDELTQTIGASRISVPERFFKVILAPYADPPRAIGFIMPNAQQIDGLELLATSVDNVEAITGFDFFSALPDSLENRIESHYNFRDWNRRKR